jgi:hypothetical protein
MTQSPNTTARLVAILQVEKEARIQCQEPGCAHGAYRAIHVVEENGKLTVLGSTCFAKRFGGANALGKAKFGGGNGRFLTPAERELLRGNTAALLDLLEKEQQMHAQVMQDKVRALHAAFHNRKPLVEPSPDPIETMHSALGFLGLGPNPCLPLPISQCVTVPLGCGFNIEAANTC